MTSKLKLMLGKSKSLSGASGMNHCLTEAGRDLGGLQAHTLAQNSLSVYQAAQDLLQVSSEPLQGWRAHHLSGSDLRSHNPNTPPSSLITAVASSLPTPTGSCLCCAEAPRAGPSTAAGEPAEQRGAEGQKPSPPCPSAQHTADLLPSVSLLSSCTSKRSLAPSSLPPNLWGTTASS